MVLVDRPASTLGIMANLNPWQPKNRTTGVGFGERPEFPCSNPIFTNVRSPGLPSWDLVFSVRLPVVWFLNTQRL